MNRAAIWVRVSNPSLQTTENQLSPLMAEATHRGLEVVKVYDAGASAYYGHHLKLLNQVYADARTGRFNNLLFWSLDRLSRQGVGPTLEIVHRLTALDVRLISLQESWIEVDGIARDLLLSVFGWVAKYESERRSERTKAGMERARTSGRHIGRPKGSKDRTKRTRSGYFARYARGPQIKE